MDSKLLYDDKYFEWQSKLGLIGGEIDVKKFIEHVKPFDKVIDFGCGGGYILKNLTASEKIGIEINPSAQKMAAKFGLKTYNSVHDVSNNWADKIISNHALEHVEDPLGTLKELYKKIKKGGTIIFVVPCESMKCKYNPNNIDNHLYTWAPINLGNLFKLAGFSVIEVKVLLHRWPPKSLFLYKIIGIRAFNIICFLWGVLYRKSTQVKIVAIKP